MTMLRSVRMSRICCWTSGTCTASCREIVVTNLPAFPTSQPPLEKKKLAARRPCSKQARDRMRNVDFPVLAMPLSQKRHCWSLPSAHCEIFYRTSTCVLGRQVGSCWRSYELKGAFVANGRRLSGFSRPIKCQWCFYFASARN